MVGVICKKYIFRISLAHNNMISILCVCARRPLMNYLFIDFKLKDIKTFQKTNIVLRLLLIRS